MKLYAIRDRFLDYYQQPFAAKSDQDVLAALSQAISNPGNTDAIAQTPHHFEIWRLGEVHEKTGLIEAGKEFLADASALVRQPGGPGRRPEAERRADAPAAQGGS